jgi:hypothetical protein
MISFYAPKFKRFGKKSSMEFLNMKRPFYTTKNKGHLVTIHKNPTTKFSMHFELCP